MRRTLLPVLVCAAITAAADDAGPIDFLPPPFLTGPVVANTMLGVTYAYQSRNAAEHSALQISIVKLPAEIRATGASADHCIGLFMTEVARTQRSFFAVPSEQLLRAGPLELSQVRWTAKTRARDLTGVTSCALDKGRYISINFHDTLKAAADSFPLIRASLKDLRIR